MPRWPVKRLREKRFRLWRDLFYVLFARQKAAKSTQGVLPRKGHRRKAEKGFNLFCARLLFVCAVPRFGEPRSSFWEGFNFVSAKPPLRRAESRFAEPRCSLQRERVYSFRLYEKNGEYPRGLRPSGLRGAIQISARYVISAEMTGVHQVTGDTEKRRVPGYRR